MRWIFRLMAPQRAPRRSQRLATVAFILLSQLCLCLLLAPLSLPLPLLATAQTCLLPSPLDLVDRGAGTATICTDGGSVRAAAGCTIQCASGAAHVGGAEFRCGLAGDVWLSQSRCASWSAVTAGPVGPFVGELLAVLSRPAAAAARQLRRHAALNATTDASGWELLALWRLDGVSSLMVSADGLSWAARDLPDAVAGRVEELMLPTVTVTATGRLTVAHSIAGTRAERGVWRSDESLRHWTLLGQGTDTSQAGARDGAAAAAVPGDPSRLVYGAGSIVTTAGAQLSSSVWLYADADGDDIGTFSLLTQTAPWSARRDATFLFVPPPPRDPDAPADPLAPLTAIPTLLCLGGRIGLTLLTDVWSSPDFGATWDVVTQTAPFSFAGGIAFAGVIWSLRQAVTTQGGMSDPYKYELWQSPNAQSWARVTVKDWRPTLVDDNFPLDWRTAAVALFPVVHRRDLVAFRGEPPGVVVPGTTAGPGLLTRTLLARGSVAVLRGWEVSEEFGEAGPSELTFFPPFDWSIRVYVAWDPRPRGRGETHWPPPAVPRLLWAAERDFGNVTAVCARTNSGSGSGSGDASAPLPRVQLPLDGALSPPLLCPGPGGTVGPSPAELSLTVLAADAVYSVRVLLAPLTQLLLHEPPAKIFRPGALSPYALSPGFEWTVRDYTITVPAGVAWPRSISMRLGVAFGTVNVSASLAGSAEPTKVQHAVTAGVEFDTDTSEALSVLVEVFLPPRGSGGAPASAPLFIVLDTLVGRYTLTLPNLCGLAGGQTFASGWRCPPGSACLVRGIDEFECAPGLLPRSLQMWHEPDSRAPGGQNATLLPSSVPVDGGPSRVELTLPPLTDPSSTDHLRVLFRSGRIDPANYFLAVGDNGEPGRVSFAAEGAAPGAGPSGGSGSCTGLVVGFPSPAESSFECWLPRGVLGRRMHLSLHLCSVRIRDEAAAAAAQGTIPVFLPSFCWALPGADSFSSPPPFFLNSTEAGSASLERLAPTADRVGPAGDLVAQGMQETLAMAVGNFPLDPQLSRVAYGSADALATIFAAVSATDADALTVESFDALVVASGAAPCTLQLGTGASSFGRVVCTTPSAASFSGQRLRFVLFAGGQLSAPSAATYSYPVRPRVDRVGGCADRGNATADCPTGGGGLRITLSGAGFSLSDLSISVAGVACLGVAVVEPERVVSCVLPAGTGGGVSVAVSSFGILSLSLPLLSYAKPTIDRIECHACEESIVDGSGGSGGAVAVRLAQCARTTNPGPNGEPARSRVLRLIGSNFGPPGSTVFVGSSICSRDATPASANSSSTGSEGASWSTDALPPDTDSSVSCFLPEGKSASQPVLLIQNNGKISESAHSVSFTPCPAGSFDPAPADSGALECELCSEGKFSALPGSAVCSPCAAGSVAPVRGSLGCSPCPPRTFQAKEGGSQCEACPSSAYAPTAGSSTCAHCPAGLYLASLSPNASSADCLPCPSGGRCSGQMITSAPDFYLRLAGDGHGSVRAFQCPAGYCTACDQAALDQAAAAAAAGALSSGLSRNETASGNRTGPGSAAPLASVVTCCASHRDPSSALCGRCAPGFEDWSGTCKRCTRSNPGLIVAFIALSTLLVAWLAHSASNASVGLTAIGLYFVQTASLEFGPAAGMLAWLQAINFNPGQLPRFANDSRRLGTHC